MIGHRPTSVAAQLSARRASAARAARNSATMRAAEWFVSFSMSLLAMLKLRDVETFSTMFLNYDLLARRWVPYGYIYPFAELAAGVLMTAGVLTVSPRRWAFSSAASARCPSSRRSISISAS